MSSCPSCVGATLETDPSGVVFCTQCSRVVEDHQFIASVEFNEGAGGSIGVVGSFVSQDGYSGGFGRSSREVTLANAKKKITEIAAKLQLNTSFIDRSHQLYKLALKYNVTKGRRLLHVLAACLYVVCRKDKTPHILLDFSDVVECNVYTLGSIFLAICRSLTIQFDSIIDPCIFIWRYAKKLEFGTELKVVVDSALDLVKRMKRDWIHVGRRPDGVCGAALLIAARMHNFSRSIEDIVEVVRCCNVTIRKRLGEFELTPSASLAVSDFETIFLEEENDPPAFLQARQQHMKAIKANEEASEGNVLKMASQIDIQLAGGDNSRAMVPFKGRKPISNDPEDLEDAEDDEVDACILTHSEIQTKTEIWNVINQDYLKEQKEKEEREARELELGIVPKKKNRRRSKNTGIMGAPVNGKPTKTKSKKLNYSALLNLGLVVEDDDDDDDEEENEEKTKEKDEEPPQLKNALVDFREPKPRQKPRPSMWGGTVASSTSTSTTSTTTTTGATQITETKTTSKPESSQSSVLSLDDFLGAGEKKSVISNNADSNTGDGGIEKGKEVSGEGDDDRVGGKRKKDELSEDDVFGDDDEEDEDDHSHFDDDFAKRFQGDDGFDDDNEYDNSYDGGW